MYSEQRQSLQQPDATIDIDVFDVDEMAATVDPWNLEMTQLGAGGFSGQFRVANVDGVLISVEFWSKKLLAVGTSPPGYFAAAMTEPRGSISWCAQEALRDDLIWSLSDREVDFLTGEDNLHYVILFPEEMIESALGCTLDDTVREQRGVTPVGNQATKRLRTLVNASLRTGAGHSGFAGHAQLKQAMIFEIVNSLLCPEGPGRRHSLRKSRLTCSVAVRLAECSAEPLEVTELAVKTGVSLRVLELAFKATLGITPLQFLTRLKLQRLYASLRESGPGDTTVTALMHQSGFTELGRTAVRFKEAFGESPSQVLKSPRTHPEWRLCDLLQTA